MQKLKNNIQNTKTINPFHAYKNRNINQKIALTGVFLGLVILFQFLENYMPFAGTYLKINFSLLFILPIFYFSGPLYGLFVVIFRFIIGPAMDSLGYFKAGIVAQLILMISSLIAIGFMYIYSFAFKKINGHNKKIIIISIFTVISTTIILTILNGLLFTPAFWWAMGYQNNISYSTAINLYENPYKPEYDVKPFFFGIKKYWTGIFGVFFIGNLVKFSLIYIVYFPLSKILNHYLRRN